METLRLTVETGNPESAASRQAIARGAEILRAGGTVAFPTETVYGLGANALDAKAVRKIFVAKERPGWDPLIVHIGERAMLRRVVAEVPEAAQRLMDAFWPGPLTLLLPRGAEVPALVTAGLEKVGVRMPAHPVTRALLQAAGVPVAAPSANRFGRISPTTAGHVAEDLDGRIDAILDGGETTFGVESTVVDVGEDQCGIYRPGAVTLEQIAAVSGVAVIFRTKPGREEGSAAAPAPGMGERHYAPRARLVLVEGNGTAQVEALAAVVRRCEEAGERAGVMLPDEFEAALIGRRAEVFRWGSWGNAGELAHRLYAGLRALDAGEATVIVCPLPEPAGIGLAIRDRLTRAAAG